MRKITSLLMLLCMFVETAWAQKVVTNPTALENDTKCVIFTQNRGGWAVKADGSQFGSTNDYGLGLNPDYFNTQEQFMLKTHDEKNYLYSVHASKYVNADRTLSETPTNALNIVDAGNDTFVFKFDDTHIINLGGSNQMSIDNWGSGAWLGTPEAEYDAGNKVTIYDISELGFDEELDALINEANSLYTTVEDNKGTQIGEYAEATATALATAIATAEAVASATEDDIAALQTAMDAVKCILPTVGQYYQIHSSFTAFPQTKAAYSNGTRPEWKTLNNDDQSFYWQAVATADGGVAFKNAKDGKYLQGHGKNEAWTLADESTNAGISVKVFAKGENPNGYEYGLIIGGYQMHAMNHGGGTGNGSYFVGYDTNNANSASSWFIVPVVYQEFHDVTYNFVYGGQVKYTTTTSVADGANYPAVVVPTLPYGVTVGATTTPEGTVTEPTEVEFTLTVERELPFKTDTWCYAQMHANGSVTAYIQDTNEATNVDWNDHIVEATEIDAHLWKFVGDIWSGIKVINKATGRAIVSTSGAAVLGDVANATAFVPTNSQANGNWFCLKYPTNNQYLNAQGNQAEGKGTVSSWTDNDNGSSLLLTEYKETEVAVSAAGYATLYLGQATYIPADVEVYAVTGIEGGWATMTAVEGVLPANTGVILKNAGTYTFKTAAATGSVEGNLLRGSVEDTYVEGEAYVLANGTKGVGLYKAKLNKDETGDEGNTHFLNNANKAYLPVAVAGARFLGFDFGTETGIGEVETESENAVIFDLAGRRVQGVQKGIFIVNGKKVVK